MKKLLKFLFGVKWLQSFYKKLFVISLKGMNIGSGSNLQNDGEIFVLNFLKSKMSNYSKPILIFDVGANIGNYTIEVKKIFKDEVIIYAFEPAEKTFRDLNKNVLKYNNIILYNVGFSHVEGKQILFSADNLSSLSSLYKRNLEHFDINMNIQESIILNTIDKFCEEERIAEILLLKLDIEGNEINALRGAERMLKNNAIKYIQFEFGGCNIDSKIFFQDFYYFLKDRYKIYRILKNNLYEIENYSELNEIFITTNYLAINKQNIV